MVVAEADEGLLLATVQVYTPASDIVRVWVYCAVSGSFNTVSVPSPTLTESLVQDTVVAGPPVEIHLLPHQEIFSEEAVKGGRGVHHPLFTLFTQHGIVV